MINIPRINHINVYAFVKLQSNMNKKAYEQILKTSNRNKT